MNTGTEKIILIFILHVVHDDENIVLWGELMFYLAIFNLEVVNTFEVVKGSPSYTGLESVKSDLFKANQKQNLKLSICSIPTLSDSIRPWSS